MQPPFRVAAPLPQHMADEYRLQRAWVVADLHCGIEDFSARLRAGPWFIQERFTPANALYRGIPVDLVISIAFTFLGETMVELVQQHSAQASPFSGARTQDQLHHIGIATSRFDAVRDDYIRRGYVPVFSAEPSGRLVMMQPPKGSLIVELLEWSAERHALFEGIRRATVDWDGSRPIRSFDMAAQ